MELKEQVTSLELSKKLKELGVKQESLFYWETYRSDQFDEAPHPKIINFKEEPGFSENSLYSAFTVAELGEMLPVVIESPPYTIQYLKQGNSGLWTLNLCDDFRHKIEFTIQEKSEADARAKMLIYLLENNLMEIPKRSPEKLAA